MKTHQNISAHRRIDRFSLRTPRSALRTPRSALRTPPAFTFIEVLFAVVILGIGLIMIAGMLPVAIKQNADTRNDLTAKVVCDSGYAYVRTLIQTHPEAFPETCGDRGDGPGARFGGQPFQLINNTMLAEFMGDKLMNLDGTDAYTPNGAASPESPTNPNRLNLGWLRAGRMMPLSYDVVRPNNTYALGTISAANLAAYPLAWHQLSLGDRIVASDPRFQWMAFYRRDEGSRVIKLVIVAMRLQTSEVVDRYRASKDPAGTVDNATLPREGIGDPQGANPPRSNGPFLVPVEFEDSLTEPDKVTFVGTPGTNAWDVDVAETGSFLIIAHSPPLQGRQTGNDAGDANRPYRNNGRIFRLAAHRTDLEPTDGSRRVWELAPGYDLNPAGAGADGIFGTLDDLPDGSMNTQQRFKENEPPIGTNVRQQRVLDYPVSDPNDTTPTFVKGTTAWAWIIGRGHLDPTTASGPYIGPTQDLGILSVDVPLP